eukprot:261308_1
MVGKYVEDDSEVSQKEFNSLNFGISVLKWLNYDEKPKHKNLKDELLAEKVDPYNSANNKQYMDEELYENYKEQALIKIQNHPHEYWSLNEMLSMKVYTDATAFQTVFRRSFWKLLHDDHELAEQDKVNKKQYYWWALNLYRAALFHAKPVPRPHDKTTSPCTIFHGLNVLNTSYRIREAILSNNETSSTSCTLAASPMLWLFATLIKNHIVFLRQTDMVEHAEETDMFENGSYYMSAERARLIYHSVHDTSILYMLEALGISNGREPMFAEMLTLEIYERSMNDPWYNIDIQQVTDELYENYLFRFTRKGKALAIFPECEEEYQYTHSSLCSLSVLMAAMDYGQNIKPWEKTCRSVTEQYFAKQKKKEKKKKHQKSKGSNSDLSFLWTFALGVSCGVAIMMFISKYNAWFKFNGFKYESIL